MAKYGDCSHLDTMPTPKLFDMTLTMSFAGLEQWCKKLLVEKQQKADYLTKYEQAYKSVDLKYLCNLSSAVQFTHFNQI